MNRETHTSGLGELNNQDNQTYENYQVEKDDDKFPLKRKWIQWLTIFEPNPIEIY